MDIKAYIRDLQIDTPTFEGSSHFFSNRSTTRSRSLADPSQPAGFVAGGSLVSFVSGISPQHQDDVLNSTLLAQLAADHDFPSPEQVMDWYGKYITVLGHLGWVKQDFAFQKYSASGSTFTMSAAILEILQAALSGDEYQVATATLNSLESLSDDDHRITVFDSKSASGSNGNFQIGTAVDAGDNVAMATSAYYFSGASEATKFLWATYSSSDVNFYFSRQSMTLHELAYAVVRQSVIDKLGANAQNYIADLDI